MKDFNRWIHHQSRLLGLLRRCRGMNFLKTYIQDGVPMVMEQSEQSLLLQKPDGVDHDLWWLFVRKLRDDYESNIGRYIVYSGLAQDGVKMYTPKELEYTAMKHVEIGVPFCDYRQPFETMVMCAPDELCGTGGTSFIIARYEYEQKVLRLIFNERNGDAWRECYSLIYDDPGMSGKTTEDHLLSVVEGGNQIEFSAATMGVRVALNSFMLLSQHTAKRLGSANEPSRAKLESKANNNKLPENIREINKSQLALIPEIYGFEQHIRVYDIIEPSQGESTGEGVPHKPHWRRGHWAQQVCGEGRKDRKLIFRRPAFINAHLFAGELSNTRVSMTLGGK